MFHAALLGESVRRHSGRALPTVDFEDLDKGATPDRLDTLARLQPAFCGYVMANVPEGELKRTLALIALAMDHALDPL